MNVVDDPKVVVAEQKGIRADPQEGAWAPVNNRPAASSRQKTRDEVNGFAVRRSEADNSVACSDVRMASAVHGDEERPGESWILFAEKRKP